MAVGPLLSEGGCGVDRVMFYPHVLIRRSISNPNNIICLINIVDASIL